MQLPRTGQLLRTVTAEHVRHTPSPERATSERNSLEMDCRLPPSFRQDQATDRLRLGACTLQSGPAVAPRQ